MIMGVCVATVVSGAPAVPPTRLRPQPDQPDREQAAEFGTPFGGGHQVWGERIGSSNGFEMIHHDRDVPDHGGPCDLGTVPPYCE